MLKNYTSKVPAHRSISYIEGKLAQHGARRVVKDFDAEGRVQCVAFSIDVGGQEIPFRLPARIEECEKALLSSLSNRARAETRKKMSQQAERTAWKIVSDWVEAQMAMVELAQVEVMEVFLPYVLDTGTNKTFFETMKDKKFRGLLASPK